MICFSSIIVTAALSVPAGLALSQQVDAEGQSVPAARVKPLPAAHAHNDYLHKRPLLDALAHGFCSVEADIFLQDDELRIGHYYFQLRAGHTLEKLYLDPLMQRIRKNDGHVYKNSDAPFTLLIDIKTDGAKTFHVLHRSLRKYASMLSGFENGTFHRRAVTVVISGSRPQAEIAATNPRWCGIDGRLGDLNSKRPAHLLPLISDNWKNHFQWRGDGQMPEKEREKLHDVVRRAHAAGRRVRFWATPESEALWKELRAAKVDLLNTDNLSRMRAFLSDNTGKSAPRVPEK